MWKRQAMDIQHSPLTLLLLVVRTNISKEINILLISDRRTYYPSKTSLKNRIHAASKFIALIPSRLIRQMLTNFFGVEF